MTGADGAVPDGFVTGERSAGERESFATKAGAQTDRQTENNGCPK
jgi:hypothetical protein